MLKQQRYLLPWSEPIHLLILIISSIRNWDMHISVATTTMKLLNHTTVLIF